MRDRFMAEEGWQHVGLPVGECLKYVETSAMMQELRKMLFSRSVPTVKDLGLCGPQVQKAFQDMGVLSFADMNPGDLSAADEEVARNHDRSRGIAVAGNGDGPGSLAEIDPAREHEVASTIDAGAS